MEIYKIAFFGHREVGEFFEVNERLYEIICKLLYEKEYIEFYVGKNGEFDTIVASTIKKAQQDTGLKNSCLILVLPYVVKDMEYLERFYDEIYIPHCVQGIYFKNAIMKRNEWMVDNADLLIFYVQKERQNGGAGKALSYAIKNKKEVINIEL